MWSYLIPVKHREPINYGCNRKMAVVRLYWARVVGFVINVYKMHRAFLCSLFRWMLNVATSSNSWDVNFDTINYAIKLRLCTWCRGWWWALISNFFENYVLILFFKHLNFPYYTLWIRIPLFL
jgi:hypothetical protein